MFCPRSRSCAVALLALSSTWCEAAQPTLVPRWQRFEVAFQSEQVHTNPADLALQVEFRSPQGSRVVPAFWDGGRVWRARVLPDLAGPWNYRTLCSVTNDSGLHGRTGGFLCTAAERGNRWREHGPLRVARAGTHFEHQDGTPFFLTANLAWHALRRESLRTVEARIQRSALNQFNAVAWTISPGRDERGEGAFDPGAPGGLNLPFLQRLDARVELLSRAGLLNVIAPAWELQTPTDVASEPQIARLWKHAMARWHANPSLWLVAVTSDSTGANIGRWRRISAHVFADGTLSPVLFLPGESQWLWEEFRGEPWITGSAFQTAHLITDDSLQWFCNGPLTTEHLRTPARPMLDLFPCTETSSESIVSARRLLWWGLLLNPPAGVSRQSDSTGQPDENSATAHASRFMQEIPFWKLKPAQGLLAAQPGSESPRKFVAVTASETRDLIVAYVPASSSVQLTGLVPRRAYEGVWFDPRTGKRTLAAGALDGTNVTYRTPDEGDWVLRLQLPR